MARFLGASGKVIAIDSSEFMISAAQERAKNTKLPVIFQVADVHQLKFANNMFNAARAERVFQHLADPKQALAEIMRVIHPGGRIVITEPDWGTLIVDNLKDKETTRAIINNQCDFIRNGWIGRQLPILFKEVGFKDIRVIPHTLTFTDFNITDEIFSFSKAAERVVKSNRISTEDAQKWVRNLHIAHQEGSFFSSITLFSVCGVKK